MFAQVRSTVTGEQCQQKAKGLTTMKTQSYGKCYNHRRLCDHQVSIYLTNSCATGPPMTLAPPFLTAKRPCLPCDAFTATNGAIWAIRCPLHQKLLLDDVLRAILWRGPLSPVDTDGSANGSLSIAP